MTEPSTQYALSVDAGDIVACDLVKQACRRHLNDLETGHERGLEFDAGDADRVIRFFSFLKHSKGEWAGHEFILEPWQEFIV